MKTAEESSGKPGEGEQLVLIPVFIFVFKISCWFKSWIESTPLYIENIYSKRHISELQVRMNNERFMVPEILFRPSDIGIQQVNPCLRKILNTCLINCTFVHTKILMTSNQMGLAEAIVESVSACDPAAQPWLYRCKTISGIQTWTSVLYWSSIHHTKEIEAVHLGSSTSKK